MRCFVACWPDDATRARLDHAARDAHQRYPGTRRVRGHNLHLTLAFIGELPSTKAHEAVRALGHLSTDAFDWRIDHVGCFDRARVMWAGGPPEARLTQLAERVREELKTLQIRFDEKRFAAHVTLLRDVPVQRPHGSGDLVDPIEPFMWPIREPVLVVSERDAQGATLYRPLQPHEI
ncbi:MAG TPA: RNA 2',3'-cyclic phosphodiesterase [Burkholderiaceae bacterium]|jgi:2'-5' RNA ligase|nr:RNA 2',3'-cyclic phosphodiesterase [Burkholderiaceae bacterium]